MQSLSPLGLSKPLVMSLIFTGLSSEFIISDLICVGAGWTIN